METDRTAADEQLLARAERALTQLKHSAGLSVEQSSTLAAIRLRLEGRERASLDDLLRVGEDDAGDTLERALGARQERPELDDLVAGLEQRRKPSLDDLL